MFGSPMPRMEIWPMPTRMPPPPAPIDIRKPASTHQPNAKYGLNAASTQQALQLRPQRPQDEADGERHQGPALRPREEDGEIVVVVGERGHEVALGERAEDDAEHHRRGREAEAPHVKADDAERDADVDAGDA